MQFSDATEHSEKVRNTEIEAADIDGCSQQGQDGLSSDKKDMWRLGKKQELKRRFRFFTIAGFVLAAGINWEFSLVTLAFTLGNGGTAGAIWMMLVVSFGLSFTMLSMAECASMAPTTGGQYHWVSEFAPPKIQKQLSFLIGWMCALGWQAGMPSATYGAAQQIVALIAVCDSSYEPKTWHTALLSMAFVTAALSFNTFAIGKLLLLEKIAMIVHFLGFFAFIITLWIMGPKEDPSTVFFEFEDSNNWGSVGLATLVGLIGPAVSLVGGDSVVHMAEELENSSYTLPRAMVFAAVANYVLAFIATVTFVSNVGDLTEILGSRTGQPWVAVMYNTTRSRTATIILLVVMISMFFFCSVNLMSTTSRQLFAFARDKGVPFHRFLSRVRPNGVPLNSVLVTLAFTWIMSLVVIGSSIAFAIITSLSAVGLFTSYAVVIGSVIAKRLRGDPFPPSKFNLGKWGLPINIIAVCSLLFFSVFLFFPAVPNPTPTSMNWSILIYGACFLLAGVYYVCKGRHEYDGPVEYTRKRSRTL